MSVFSRVLQVELSWQRELTQTWYKLCRWCDFCFHCKPISIYQPYRYLLVSERRLLWNTLRWLCNKNEHQKVPLYSKLAQLPLCPLPEMKIWKFQVKLDFRIPSGTLPPPPPLETKSLQIWNFKVKLYFRFQSATPQWEIKSFQIWNFQVKVDFIIPSATPPPPQNGKLADLELSSQIALQISKFQSARK